MGVGREAEQPGPLGPQGEDPRDRGVVVERAAAGTAVHEHPPHALPQVATVGVGQKRLDARPRVGDRPAVAAALLGRGSGSLADRLGAAGEVALGGEKHRLRLLVLEDVLRERREQPGEFLVDRSQPLLRRRVELGPGPDEVGVVQPGQPLLLGREPRSLPGLVDGGHPRKEFFVLDDLVGEGGEPRRHPSLDLLHRVIVEAIAEHIVDGADAVEHPARLLERRRRVGERGRLGVGGDRVDAGELIGHAGLQGGLEVGDASPIEGGHTAIRAHPRGEQRIGRGRCCGLGGGGHGRHPEEERRQHGDEHAAVARTARKVESQSAEIMHGGSIV